MKIYMSNIEQTKNIANMEKDLSVLDRHRLTEFSNNTRKLQFLVSRALVKQATGKNVIVDKNGAPTIESGFVSIAHKDNFVIVAISCSGVGIDIENASINRDFIGQSELLGLPKPRNKKDFYKNFVKYEAEFKFGKTSEKTHKYFYEMGDYLICVCTNEPVKDIQFDSSYAAGIRFFGAE